MNKDEAERQIGAILEALERESGCIVESVDIKDIDHTTMSDVTKQIYRSISIELAPVPGTYWRK